MFAIDPFGSAGQPQYYITGADQFQHFSAGKKQRICQYFEKSTGGVLEQFLSKRSQTVCQ